MQIHFKGTNYQLEPKVSEFAKRKIEGLKKHLGPYERPAQIYVDLERRTEAHHSGAIWRADINVDVEGTRYHAAAERERIEAAIDAAVAEVGREIQTARKRKHSLVRRGGAKVKAFLRGIAP